jgi:O-antigen ligase
MLGSGIGTYEAASRHVFEGDGVWRTSAHNHHLTVLIEGGVLGLCAWLAACAGVLFGLRRAWESRLASERRALLCAATVYLAAIASLSFFHDVLYHPGTAVLTWLCAGAALGSGALPAAVDAGAGEQLRHA